MQWQFGPYSLALATTGTLNLALVLYVWRRRPAPGATDMFYLILAACIWAGGLEIIAIVFFILGALAALIDVVAPLVFAVLSLVGSIVAAIPAIYVWRWNVRHAL